MRLDRVDDPRDNLAKATRYAVWKFAKANGIDFPEDAPADVVRAALRQKGLRNIPVNRPPLGAQNGPAGGQAIVPDAQGVEVDATADLAAQWERDRRRDLETGKTKRPERHNPMNELRAKAKELGIKVERRDRVDSLRAKIEAASGKDTSERDQ